MPRCPGCEQAAARDRAGLKRLLRYCARPPFALERLDRIDEQHVIYRLPRPQRNGTTALSLTPLEPALTADTPVQIETRIKKLSKMLIDRRMAQMRTEGVQFHTHAHVGVGIPIAKRRDDYDAVVLAGGSEKPCDLDVPGRSTSG